MTVGTVPVDGGSLWYEIVGPPAAEPPVVVLAHSGGVDARLWEVVLADLGRDHRVVRYDARGHGRSSSIAGDFRGDEDLKALLDHVEAERAVVVGNSLGGLVAVDLALEHPERVAGLVLAAPGLSGHAFSSDALQWQADVAAAATAALQTMDPGPLVETVLRGLVDGPHRRPDQVDAGLRAMVAELVLTTVMTHYTNHGEAKGAHAVDRLGEVTVPVLVLIGTLDFADLVEIADLIAERAPKARKVVLDGVGHLVQNEAPQRFLAEVRAFLAELPEHA